MAQFFDKRFVELILAPSFSEEALAHFAKKKNLRLLQVDLDAYLNRKEEHMVRAIDGGFVVQREDRHFCEDISMVSENKELADQKDLMNFGMVAGKHLRSNAIALVAQNDDCVRLVGAGMGNPNRLISTMQAIDKFKENGHSSMDGVLLVSDAFFPFRDNIDLANEHGIKLVLQPGGSIRDEEVIAACNEFGMSMATTGYRHFRH
jgi:phosphoribosylaminoimidazolecarboxamide formyltransferase/IMP cyclohydrolase